MDKYDVARKSEWRQNRFKISNISIIDHWGDKKSLPETLTINLAKDAAWALGMIELPAMIDDELAVKHDTCNIKYDKKKVKKNSI